MTKPDQAKEFLARRRTVYAKTFAGVYADEVLADLAKFCRANETTFHPDQRVHAVLEGRREVWLRIQQHLNLSDEDLWRIFANQPRG